MKAERGILLKAEITSKYKAIFISLMKEYSYKFRFNNFSLSESLTGIYQHSFTEFSGVSLEIWPSFLIARKYF